MAWSIERKVNGAFVSAIAFWLAIAATSYVTGSKLAASVRSISHADAVIRSAQQALISLGDESGRADLLLRRQLDQVRSLVVDSPELRGRVAELQPTTPPIVIRATLDAVIADERRLLAEWQSYQNRRLREAGVATTLVVVLALVVTGLAFWIARRDLRRRFQAEAALGLSESRARSLIENMLDGLVITDGRGWIEAVNEAAGRMLGAPVSELLGKNSALLGASASKCAPLVGQIFDTEMQRLDGQPFPAQVSLSPFPAPEGIRYAISFRDMTAQREIEVMKREFVSTVSHELRTPLTSIRGSLGLLSGGVLGEMTSDAQEVVKIAERNTVRLISLINDILDLDRLERGQMEIRHDVLPIQTVLDRSTESVKGIADQQAVPIRVPASGVSVIGDPDRLQQVLVNLLSNAIKFSPKGAPVRVEVESLEGVVEVRVIDSGRGVPKEFQESIFERFQQVESSDSRQKGGTGLGLAICRGLVEGMLGTIGVKSEPGTGSTFWFRVPLASQGVPPVARLNQALGALARPILVCDADEASRAHIVGTLEQHGYPVLQASTEVAMLEALRTAPCALAVINASLIGKGGWDGLHNVRDSSGLRHLPLIIVGTNVLVSPETLVADMAVYLPTPIEARQLADSIRLCLPQAPHASVLLVDDDVALHDVIRRQLTPQGVQLRSAYTGRQALQVMAAEPPALVVLDVGLPEGDGFDVVSNLRASPALANLPILVYTGRDLTSEQRHRLTLGRTRFLTKSRASDEEFRALVLEMLQARSGREAVNWGSKVGA